MGVLQAIVAARTVSATALPGDRRRIGWVKCTRPASRLRLESESAAGLVEGRPVAESRLPVQLTGNGAGRKPSFLPGRLGAPFRVILVWGG
jgi:hypothetical protein